VATNSAKLNWNSGNIEPITSYIVQYRRKYSASDVEFEEVSDVTDSEYMVPGLDAHTLYELRVLAVNGIGRSLPSTPVDVTTGELGQNCI